MGADEGSQCGGAASSKERPAANDHPEFTVHCLRGTATLCAVDASLIWGCDDARPPPFRKGGVGLFAQELSPLTKSDNTSEVIRIPPHLGDGVYSGLLPIIAPHRHLNNIKITGRVFNEPQQSLASGVSLKFPAILSP